MGLDLLVGHPVIVEVGGGGEALAASLAPVRLLSGVNPPVRVQAGAGGELLGAEVAGVRPLPCVDPYVPLQQAGSVKFLATGGAWKQPLGLIFGFLQDFQGVLFLIHNINFKILILLLLLIC